MSISNKTTLTADPGKPELFISREFDSPRDLVFKAFTDPKLYVQWMGPRGYKMKLTRFEPRSGGSWRFIHTDMSGKDHAFHGVFHEVLEQERIIDTFEYEGLPESGHVSLETVKFEALPGERTRVTTRSVFQSVADRDGMIQSGMKKGVDESHERLDELLARLEKRLLSRASGAVSGR